MTHKKWEYIETTFVYAGIPLVDFLNEQGEDGWELVSKENLGPSIYILIFKRSYYDE